MHHHTLFNTPSASIQDRGMGPLTQNEFNQVIDLLANAVIAKIILFWMNPALMDIRVEEHKYNETVRIYHEFIAMLYKKYKNIDVPSDAYKVYKQAVLEPNSEKLKCDKTRNYGMNSHEIIIFWSGLDIELVQQQLNADFLNPKDERLQYRYNGTLPFLQYSPARLKVLASYKRAERVHEALSHHPVTFFTGAILDSPVIGGAMIGVDAYLAYQLVNSNSRP